MMAINDREKKLVIFGGGGLVLFLVLWFLVPALFSGDSGTIATVGKQKSDLDSIMRLYRDFANVQAEYNKIASKVVNQKNLSLLAELENLADQAEIKSNIEAMESKPKPKNEYFKEEAVDIRLIKISLKQVLTFLYAVEYSPKVLRIKKLHLEVRYDNPDMMNAQIEVATFKPLD